MKSLICNFVALLFCISTTAYAAVAPVEEGSSLLVILFVGFFALIIVLQLVPACLLFIGMIKGLLFHETKSGEKRATLK